MKRLFLLATATMMTFASFAQTKWVTDPMHSSVNFEVKHLGIALVQGHFDKYEGSLTSDKADFSDAKIDFTVVTQSVNTKVPPRDEHLRSDDFFNVAEFPEMKFVSTGMKKLKGDEYELSGKLTIRDVTKPVVFKVNYGGVGKDMQGNDKAGFRASATINRLDYNIKFDPTGKGVGKEVNITLDLEFAKAK